MKIILTILFLAVFTLRLSAYEKSTIDTVISYRWGTGQTTGQSPEYFPMNIFGKPDTSASENVPASSAENVCSLGFDGEIVVAFKGYEIVDGPGADFTIFENAFINPVTNKIFAEPAVVSVSYDGVNFTDFPFDTLTLRGCAGKTPTNGKNDCFNPAVSGGDTFDLATIGLEKIRFIKIRDVSKIVLNNPQHPYYDPIITGFDLDAVCGLHLRKIPTGIKENKMNSMLTISTVNSSLHITLNEYTARIEVYNITGRCIAIENNSNTLYIRHLKKGLYFIIVRKGGKIIHKSKVVI